MFRRCLQPRNKVLTCATPWVSFKDKIKRQEMLPGAKHYKHSVYVMSKEKYQQEVWKEKGLFVYTAGVAAPVFAVSYFFSA